MILASNLNGAVEPRPTPAFDCAANRRGRLDLKRPGAGAETIRPEAQVHLDSDKDSRILVLHIDARAANLTPLQWAPPRYFAASSRFTWMLR
jgi:serine/threonine protein kinase HipA of HipAB toxin-antitoxin module